MDCRGRDCTVQYQEAQNAQYGIISTETRRARTRARARARARVESRVEQEQD
jgi:hypothetical protein